MSLPPKQFCSLRPVGSTLAVVFCAFACLCFLLVCAQPSFAQNVVADGVRGEVRNIYVDIGEIFEEEDLGFFYRTVNTLKFSTKEKVVRRELLLEPGDEFSTFLLQESERNLRRLPFFREVSITPIEQNGFIDLYVSVQDTWTLFPFFNVSAGGGTNRRSAGVADSNLFGYGKRLEFLVADDEGRQKIEAVWDDPRLFGSYQRLTLGHFQRSDGYRTLAIYGRPFRSLTEKYSWGMEAQGSDLVGRLFRGGEERYIFREEQKLLSGGFTFSEGDPLKRRVRTSFGYRYSEMDFTQADRDDFRDIAIGFDPRLNRPELVPRDRTFSGPFASYEVISQDFLSLNFVDRFRRVEDYNLGNELNLQAQYAPEAFGSLGNTLLMRASDSDGWRLSPTAFLRAAVSSSARLGSSKLRNILLRAEAKYYNILGPLFFGQLYLGKHTLGSSFVADFGVNLDRDREFLLGANSGLRGYEDRTFTGDQRLLLNLEDRFHLVEDVLKLVSVGGAVFFDVGGTSRRGFGDIVDNELYANVGVGLRLGLTRSSGGNVVRVDLAFPLREAIDGTQEFAPRLLITSGQVFSANLSTERSQNNSAQVSSGFLQ